MTAIVGVMNRHAVAIAADSAETIGNGAKIYNSANKIITLSKFHPVGISIYGAAAMNNHVPWEIIIKDYRQKKKSASHPSLRDYVNDFFDKILSNPFFMDSADASSMLSKVVYDTWKNLVRDVWNGVLPKETAADQNKAKITTLDEIYSNLSSCQTIETVAEITQDDFWGGIMPVKEQICKDCDFGEDTSVTEILTHVFTIIYMAFVKKSDLLPFYSGLAFFGYGDNEYYPRLYRTRVSSIIQGKLAWYLEESCEITNSNPGIICPMAQVDVMHTIIGGVDPNLQENFIECTAEALVSTLRQLHSHFSRVQPNLAKQIEKINIGPIIEVYRNKINKAKQVGLISPLMNTISYLEKEDLAEVAENLIYLTSLKRKITPNVESVGGPIDVAVVSKGDGFIWLKRKHYFDPQLNVSYLDKYLR